MNFKIVTLFFSVAFIRCEETQPLFTTTSGLNTMLNMLGYDDRKLGNMALNMLLYVGELTANSLLDVDNNIDSEIPQYRSLSDSGDIFSFLKVAVERSTRRGEEIKSVLLDENLSTTMIERVKETA